MSRKITGGAPSAGSPHAELLYYVFPILYRRKPDIECGSGWNMLIDCLSAAIEKHNMTTTRPIWAVQIKSKFGKLRFYVVGSSVPGRIERLINVAEDMSGNICEKCGSGNAVTAGIRGWIWTMCPRCARAEKRRVE